MNIIYKFFEAKKTLKEQNKEKKSILENINGF